MAAFDSVKRGGGGGLQQNGDEDKRREPPRLCVGEHLQVHDLQCEGYQREQGKPEKGEGRQRPVGGNRHEQRAYERPDDNANKHQWAIDNSAQAWTEYEQADSGYGLRCAQHNVTADQAAAKREQLVAQ